MSSKAMYYYHVFPSHNTQDFLRTTLLGEKRGEKYFFVYQYIINYDNEKMKQF